MKDFSSDVSFIITTAFREMALLRLLSQIAKVGLPKKQVIVINSGSLKYRERLRNISLFDLNVNCGISTARNTGLNLCSTPYFILFEDDFVINDIKNLFTLYNFITRTPRIDILGGRILLSKNKEQRFPRQIWIDNDILYYKLINLNIRKQIVKCDFIGNWFIASTERVREIGWDPFLKLNEHYDFFLRAQQACLYTAYTTKAEIYHTKWLTPEYRNIRRKESSFFLKEFFKKWQILSIKEKRGRL